MLKVEFLKKIELYMLFFQNCLQILPGDDEFSTCDGRAWSKKIVSRSKEATDKRRLSTRFRGFSFASSSLQASLKNTPLSLPDFVSSGPHSHTSSQTMLKHGVPSILPELNFHIMRLDP